MKRVVLTAVMALFGTTTAISAADLPITSVQIEFEAGYSFFQPWTSGTTYHVGVGYIKPFGAASYTCGTGYKEAEKYPVPSGLEKWFISNSIDKNPLFCIYHLKDGDIFVRDYLIGHEKLDPTNNVRNDEVVDIVLGGSGNYRNASGVWTGTTDGRGDMKEVRPGYKLPASILKLMDGYIRYTPRDVK